MSLEIKKRNEISYVKLLANGANKEIAQTLSKGGFLTLEQSKLMSKFSRKLVKFICEFCHIESYCQVRRIGNRKNGLAYKPICNICIHKASGNTTEARMNNKKAQLKVQGKLEQRVNNSLKNMKGNKSKYDIAFGNRIYKEIIINLYDKTCQNCFSEGQDFHHIDFGINSHPSNLSYLCKSCHTTIHNFWRQGGKKKAGIISKKLKLKAIKLNKIIEQNCDEKSQEYQAKKIFRYCSRLEHNRK